MRTLIIICQLTVFFITSQAMHAQAINWNAPDMMNSHRITGTIGMDYGIVFGMGYGYQFNIHQIPVEANISFSIPSGDHLLDDYKTKLGANIRWFKYNDFMFSTNIHGVFRRYSNSFVHVLNFGSDLSGVIGYYRPQWFVAGEVGFDKAIVTRFDHQQAYLDQYADVTDGWYEPDTGGNFYYGLQTGFTYRKNDIHLKAGKILEEDFKSSPTLPYYGQVGYSLRF